MTGEMDEKPDGAVNGDSDDPMTIRSERRRLTQEELDVIRSLSASVPGDERLSDRDVIKVSKVPRRYDDKEELGRGAMGVVHLSLDRDLNREVARKTLLPSEAQRSGSRARLIREARLGGSLEHPNIIPVYELGRSEDGNPFFTMRRMQGRSLADVLREHRKVPAEANKKYSRIRLLNMFTQICMAVEFAHDRGVVHRDIKPSNIMLGDFGEV